MNKVFLHLSSNPTAVASADIDATIEEIRKRLINNDYKPRNLLRTEIPKKGLGVRPGATMWVEDAIVLNTIMYLLAFPLNDLLSPNVYSFRLREEVKKKQKYENGKDFFNDTTVAELPFLKRSTIYKKFLQYDESRFYPLPFYSSSSSKMTASISFSV